MYNGKIIIFGVAKIKKNDRVRAGARLKPRDETAAGAQKKETRAFNGTNWTVMNIIIIIII